MELPLLLKCKAVTLDGAGRLLGRQRVFNGDGQLDRIPFEILRLEPHI